MLSLNGIHTDVNICCFRDRRLSWGIRCCNLRQFCVEWSWKVTVCFTSISINMYCNEIHVTIIFKTNKLSVKHVYDIYIYTFLTQEQEQTSIVCDWNVFNKVIEICLLYKWHQSSDHKSSVHIISAFVLSLLNIHTVVNICGFRDRRSSWGFWRWYMYKFSVVWSWNIWFTSVSADV